MSRKDRLPIFVNGTPGTGKIVKKRHGNEAVDDGVSVIIEVPFHYEGNTKAFLDKMFQEAQDRRA